LSVSASPGGSLRVFGKNLGSDGKDSSPKTVVFLQGPKGVSLPGEARCYVATVDILVIRQETTETGGYHTKPAACRGIFLFALSLCRQLQETAAHIGRK
jgi:hypothetical protein